MDTDAYEVSTDPARLDLDLVHEVLTNSYWALGRARSVTERAIRNSLCFGVYRAGSQVAFARVVSDLAVFAYLADVFVLPEHRGQGVATRMLREILAHPGLQHLRTFMLATRDAHDLYARLGWTAPPHPERLMVIHDPDSDRHAR